MKTAQDHSAADDALKLLDQAWAYYSIETDPKEARKAEDAGYQTYPIAA